ncbi:hypothetical protein TBLA_0A02010 [Henningerozyma blattae CBS 6284]|uniref:Uncharacterized protein n=1 Tax=Henningerozyma blattae (strain ATCC 34711 / CBS 6284 / DSM 70876 / NBRC 10599 / NRRL Y-10934 / UCD 77-7) TaxID=1071380 RepID=I2GV50_HENB6|nr:hypothetical protein TBLA_0A02010 [Tetrapisispora blattae CBS 6284]CCH58002.1 hypothetical protein TBLA_0A02010 [Tetrapisispora blattae CBS 6284]
MGIPVDIYDNSIEILKKNKKILSSVTETIQEGLRHTLIDSLSSSIERIQRNDQRNISLQSNNGYNNEIPSNGIPFRWTLTRSNNILLNSGDMQGLKAINSKNGPYWIIHSTHKIIIYDYLNNKLIQVSSLENGLYLGPWNNPITCIDCNVIDNDSILNILVGQESGRLFLLKYNLSSDMIIDQTVLAVGRRNQPESNILDCSTMLLPDYCIAFSNLDGLVFYELNRDTPAILRHRWNIFADSDHLQNSSLNSSSILGLNGCIIDFPKLLLFDSTNIWYFHDILDDSSSSSSINNIPLPLTLKPGEIITKINPVLNSDSLILETTQRILEVNTNSANPSSPTMSNNNVFYRSPGTCHVTGDLDYIFACEEHLYGTALSIYTNNLSSNEWSFLGCCDLKASFGVSHIKGIYRSSNNTLIVLVEGSTGEYCLQTLHIVY